MYRQFVVLLLLALGATSCSVDAGSLVIARSAATATSSADTVDGLPAVGPIPGSSHWHAAYVVRICNDVLAPFDSDNDPLGIHSHADGVMHIHPFFAESGYEAAGLDLFADAMGFQLADGELTLPGGGTWRDGDLCDGVPSRVFVDKWELPDPASAVTRIFNDLDQIRFLADGELYQIAFAPVDSAPVVPPSASLIPQLSNLSPAPEPWIDVGSPTATQVSFWQVSGMANSPCDGDAVVERALSEPFRCFDRATEPIELGQASTGARAVLLNRQPAVEIQVGPALRSLITEHFTRSSNPLVLAIEVDGAVVTAPQIVAPLAGDRLVVSRGFTTETAKNLAAILNG